MRPRTRSLRWIAATALAIAAMAQPAAVRASQATATQAGLANSAPLTDEVATRLSRGETVRFDQTVENDERRYVGGVTYTIVAATAAEVTALIEDVPAYQKLLPRTKSARLMGVNGPDFWVELHQGTSLVETSYTLRMHHEADGRTVRFWLDPNRPHGIADAWGFFRVETLPEGPDGMPRVLLTYGALVDPGPGIVRDLFEERLRGVLLSVPQRLQQYAATHLRGRDRG